MTMGTLTREQNAYGEFMSSAMPFLVSFKGDSRDNVPVFIDAVVDASASFGMSELAFRTAERNEQSGLPRDARKLFAAQGKLHNEKGLRLLEHALSAISAHKALLPEDPPKRKKLDLSAYRNEVLSYFQDVEMKASDVAKLAALLDEVSAEALKGEKALLAYIEVKLKELAKARSGKDRGAVDNIPWWKLLAIAIYYAVGVWDIIRCYWSGNSCSKIEQGAYKAAMLIASLIKLFC